MLVLITYDVSVTSKQGQRRLRHISKTCLDYGVRVQNSVFECEVDPSQYIDLKAKLLEQYDKEEDSLRFYLLGKKGRTKIEHFGAKTTKDPLRGDLIF